MSRHPQASRLLLERDFNTALLEELYKKGDIPLSYISRICHDILPLMLQKRHLSYAVHDRVLGPKLSLKEIAGLNSDCPGVALENIDQGYMQRRFQRFNIVHKIKVVLLFGPAFPKENGLPLLH